MNNPFIKLSTKTTDYIDAYKTLSSPSILIKELIENSIDAISNEITILINTSLNYIEIADNGSGIALEFLSNLCKRFNSSKLNNYEEIKNDNFNKRGFRGEALSIISYLGNLNIITKGKSKDNINYVYSGLFSDGKLLDYKFGCSDKNISNNFKELIEIEFNNIVYNSKDNIEDNELLSQFEDYGTKIIIDNLYSTNPLQKESVNLKQEIDNIIKIVQYYSVHFWNIGFTILNNTNKQINKSNKMLNVKTIYNTKTLSFIKKRTSIINDIENKINNSSSNQTAEFDIKNNIINLVLNSIQSKELIEISNNIETLNCRYNIICSKTSFNIERDSTLIVFINDRLLLKTNNIKAVISCTYEKLSLKKSNYFCYISIEMNNSNIDINCSNNKSKILLLNENEIYSCIANSIFENLSSEMESINIYSSDYKEFTQKTIKNRSDMLYPISSQESNKNNSKDILYPKDKIRVDRNSQMLEVYLHNITKNKNIDYIKDIKENDNELNNKNVFKKEDDNIESKIKLEYCSSNSNNITQNHYDKQIKNKNKEEITSNNNLKDAISHNYCYSENTNLKSQIYTLESKITKELFKTFEYNLFDKYFINKEASNIIKNNILIGIDNSLCAYIQYEKSLYIVNTQIIVEDYFLYLYVSYINTTNKKIINSNFNYKLVYFNDIKEFSIDDIIQYTEDIYDISYEESIYKIKNNNIDINDIISSINKCKDILQKVNINIEINSIYVNNEHKYYLDVSLFILQWDKHSIEDVFSFYQPIITYFIVRLCIDNSYKNNNTVSITPNLSFLLESIKIICLYISNSVFYEYNKILNDMNITEENMDSSPDTLCILNKKKELISYIFDNIKINNYYFRNSLPTNEFIKKLTDTESLYSAYERC